MKHLLLLIPVTFFLNGQAVFASEVTDCFEKAWRHPDNGGLGLTRGMAIELCKGTTNASEVIACFEKAWGHPSKGGLGLTRGGALDLCTASAKR